MLFQDDYDRQCNDKVMCLPRPSLEFPTPEVVASHITIIPTCTNSYDRMKTMSQLRAASPLGNITMPSITVKVYSLSSTKHPHWAMMASFQ